MSDSTPARQDTVGDTPATDENVQIDIPVATKQSSRTWQVAWIVPALALIFVVYLAVQFFSSRGPELLIVFDNAYGIHENDRVTHKGTQIGTVESSVFNPDTGHIEVKIRLKPENKDFARSGAQAWIVRPELSLTRVSGLDTIVGASYVEMSRGDGESITVLEGLSEKPLLTADQEEGLRITLRRSRKGSADRGSPLLYKGLHAGVVLKQTLRNDGGGVDVQAIVYPEFAHLVCEQSVFWDSGGIDMQVGLRGLGVQAESLESVLTGSISFATPPAMEAGKAVRSGHAFSVHADPDDEWLQWNPRIPRTLPIDTSSLRTVPITKVRSGRFLGGGTQRGQATTVAQGYLMLDSLASGDELKSHLLGDDAFPGESERTSVGEGVVIVHAAKAGPVAELAIAEAPADVYVALDGESPLLYITAEDLSEAARGVWSVEGQLMIPEVWHGTPVYNNQGKIIGIFNRISETSANIHLITQLP